MTEDVAKRSIDWLHSIGSRVLAFMGGEPLLRPKFIHKIIYYSAKNDIFVYLPTNGRLMKPDVIDRLGDAGSRDGQSRCRFGQRTEVVAEGT